MVTRSSATVTVQVAGQISALLLALLLLCTKTQEPRRATVPKNCAISAVAAGGAGAAAGGFGLPHAASVRMVALRSSAMISAGFAWVCCILSYCRSVVLDIEAAICINSSFVSCEPESETYAPSFVHHRIEPPSRGSSAMK